MKNVALIIQAFGLGDVIFAQGVVNHFISQGYKVVWPVKPYFVDGLSRAYPKVTFLPDDIFIPQLFMGKEDVQQNGIRVIPLRWGDMIMKVEPKYWMRAKFDMYGLDYKEWKEHARFRRDVDREESLMRQLGIGPGESFNLISETYGSDFGRHIPITVDNGLKNVMLKQVEDYSLFDWSTIIQRATNIHVVNSSIFYLLELLDLSAKEVHLYARTPIEKGFPYVDYLMERKYILHE